ncbi:methionyl-tRNA formyltransferase [Anoxybacter fermentans]|uniref:Methionyl-tRNA formyltransferase n=1 Tax=Anoxybacter fermentans TaxID=1323375 RepID=A0A3Q9HRL7_9FIRM|nr:methionyl-tRNA formyltransferase [Anoxybacter fermentans]AZR72965.1 methionyl-tRNA formyltransferase [Anoxybacter fermentans]
MRVVFMGTPDFAAICLKGLLNADFIDVIGVVTQPDRARGRGYKVTYSPVKKVALEANLPVYQPENVNDSEFVDKLEGMNLDAIVVVAYGQLLKERLLNLTPYGCINVHASLLPKYRGAGPIHRVIINGETKTGITTMYMDKGWDTGDMILQKEVEIGSEMTVGELHDILAELGSEVLVETLRQIKNGTAPRIPQQHEKATYAPKIKKEDGEIDWNQPARKIYNLVRGMDPWPGAYTWYKGEIFKIWKTRIEENLTGGIPGQVMDVDLKKGILVQTKEGGLWLTEVQSANSRRMDVGAFLNGHNVKKGEVFGNAK